jgi:hypothetical protein
MSIEAPATNPASNLALKLPATIGSANQFLKNSGTAGTLGWSSVIEDSSGNVGINKSNPSYPFVARRTDASGIIGEFANSSGYGLWIGQASASGEAYLRTGTGQALAFKTNGDNERMRITNDGKLLLGSTSAAGHTTVSISASDYPTFRLWDDAESDNYVMRYENSTQRVQFINNHNGMYLERGGTGVSSLSDERAKDIVSNITGGFEKVKGLRTVIGNYKSDPDKYQKPFLIAQDVQKVLPEAVSTRDPNNLGLNYTDVIPLLTNALQEAITKIETLETKVAALEAG